MTALGYSVCVRCNQPELSEVTRVTDGLCARCWHDHVAAPTKVIEVMVSGERMAVNTAKRRKRRPNRGRPETKAAAAAAKRRAMRRLRAAFPDFYDMLVAEERARAGLVPYPWQRLLSTGSGASETFDFAATYHALAEAGVDLDTQDAGDTQPTEPGP